MDYCAKESTLQPEGEIKSTSIKMDIQETYKVLSEMDSVLSEFESIVKGPLKGEDRRKDANCLCDEARMVTGLAYDCLQKILRIRECII